MKYISIITSTNIYLY